MSKFDRSPSNQDSVRFSGYTPESRTRAFRYYFGLKNGTVEELAAAAGLSVSDILERPYGDEPIPLASGFSAVRTCGLDWRRDTLAPQHQGDWAYWRDVIRGFWITGPLDGFNPDYHANHAH